MPTTFTSCSSLKISSHVLNKKKLRYWFAWSQPFVNANSVLSALVPGQRAPISGTAVRWFTSTSCYRFWNSIDQSERAQYLAILWMGYWPCLRSTWLDIGQVLSCLFMDRDEQAWPIKNLFWTDSGCLGRLIEADVRSHPVGKFVKLLLKSPKGSVQLRLMFLILWFSGKFSLRDMAGSPERAR